MLYREQFLITTALLNYNAPVSSTVIQQSEWDLQTNKSCAFHLNGNCMMHSTEYTFSLEKILADLVDGALDH